MNTRTIAVMCSLASWIEKTDSNHLMLSINFGAGTVNKFSSCDYLVSPSAIDFLSRCNRKQYIDKVSTSLGNFSKDHMGDTMVCSSNIATVPEK